MTASAQGTGYTGLSSADAALSLAHALHLDAIAPVLALAAAGAGCLAVLWQQPFFVLRAMAVSGIAIAERGPGKGG